MTPIAGFSGSASAPWPDGFDALLSRCRFPDAGTAVTCAVSGGSDSLALLALAVGAGCVVTAVHVDHGLRVGSAAEADVVAAAADRFGAAFRADRVTVELGPNLEARARAARRSVLPSDVLTGHTADDQAETIILNLIRGAGLSGLAGMAHEGHPILSLRRHETHQLCRDLGLTPVVDPTNDSPAHRRNRVRHELLPLLVDVSERDIVPVLVRQAEVLRLDAEALDAASASIDPTNARALADAPPALARRAIRTWLTEEHPPDLATVDRVLAVARGEATGCDVSAGRRVQRTQQRLRIESRSL